MKHASFSDRQRVRYLAADLFDKGLSHAEIARRFGVSRQSVCRWYKLWLEGGEAGLKVKQAGHASLTTDEQWRLIQDALLEGPAAHGYDTEFWTLERIGDLVYKITGVKYHQGHIWKLLSKLDWSYQKPEKVAKQRDEEAIARWKLERWPHIKKGRRKQAHG
jgi:transposase